MFSLAALALLIAAVLVGFAGWLLTAAAIGAASCWCMVKAYSRPDDIQLLFGLFLMAVVAMGIIRLAYALVP